MLIFTHGLFSITTLCSEKAVKIFRLCGPKAYSSTIWKSIRSYNHAVFRMLVFQFIKRFPEVIEKLRRACIIIV